MEVQGKIKKIGETKTFGSKGFRKREVVIVTEDQYPQSLLIEFVQDKCDLLNNYKLQDDVKININLRGREWENPEGEIRYFNTIQGWRIEKIDHGGMSDIPPPTAQYETPFPKTTKPSNSDSEKDEEDDLPF